MFAELFDIDWSSMQHAYGSAEEIPALLVALGSSDADERGNALNRFYNVVHHQGSVYRCTTASLPFLFELAVDAATPERAEIVELLVSIGEAAVENSETVDYIRDVDYSDYSDGDYGDYFDYVGAATMLRARAEVFVECAAESDFRMRRAAIPALALFLDDAFRAAALLRDRFTAETGVTERLLVVEAMATLAIRLPTTTVEALAWFDALATDTSASPEIRLAALAQRCRCAPDQIGPEVVHSAIGLLRQITHATPPAQAAADTPPTTVPADNVPPQILAAFEQLDDHDRMHAPTTKSLGALHQALGSRVAERTELLAEQLRSPDPGTRLDAIRMADSLITSWRGDHSALIAHVADQLATAGFEVSAAAAAVLERCHPIAEPVRETLAEHVAAQRMAHGPDVWTAPDPWLRRAHQQAVRALARLGDIRAVPSLLAALNGEIDTWRAIEVAGDLPQASDQLTSPLCEHLRRVDLTHEMTACSMLSALAALGDPAALPVITETLAAAVRHEQWQIACSASAALTAFGPAAVPALETIRPLTAASDVDLRGAAVAALWAIGGDRDEVLPLLLEQLDSPYYFGITGAADILGRIGPAAAVAAPRLRELLTADYEWIRIHCAAALWEIGGEPEAPTVLDTILRAWATNDATANYVVECLDRMGPAATPALPQLRTELALLRRGGWFAGVDDDERLQRVCRAIITQLA